MQFSKLPNAKIAMSCSSIKSFSSSVIPEVPLPSPLARPIILSFAPNSRKYSDMSHAAWGKWCLASVGETIAISEPAIGATDNFANNSLDFSSILSTSSRGTAIFKTSSICWILSWRMKPPKSSINSLISSLLWTPPVNINVSYILTLSKNAIV